MSCLTANHTSNRNQCVVLSCLRQLLARQRQFERSRNAYDLYIFTSCAGALQRIQRSRQQPLCNKTVEPAHRDSKPQSRRAQLSAHLCRLNLCHLCFFSAFLSVLSVSALSFFLLVTSL